MGHDVVTASEAYEDGALTDTGSQAVEFALTEEDYVALSDFMTRHAHWVRPFKRWHARRHFHSAAAAAIRGPRRIKISTTGVQCLSGVGTTLTPWSSVRDVAVTPIAAYYLSADDAQIVPRHGFASDDAFEKFNAAARRFWQQARA